MIESCITFLPVSDLKRTVQFYTEVIGLTLWKDMGSCVILDCGKGYWGFCQYEDGRPLATGACMSLNCTDRLCRGGRAVPAADRTGYHNTGKASPPSKVSGLLLLLFRPGWLPAGIPEDCR